MDSSIIDDLKAVITDNNYNIDDFELNSIDLTN